MRSRLRARQQSQSSPDPAGKDSATSSPMFTEASTYVRLSFQSRSLLLLADESSGVTVTKTSEHVSSLKSDRNLFSRLYVASQFRDGNLGQCFSRENQQCPPSLSDRGKLKLGTKSDIVRCLEDAIEEQDGITPSVEVVVIDGPAIVHMLKPPAARTFREYVQDVFVPYIEHQLDNAQRVDVVWNDYRSDSLKAQTRGMRGKGIRRRVEPNNAVPKNWAEFLRINENKAELFAFLSREIVTISTDKQSSHSRQGCNLSATKWTRKD